MENVGVKVEDVMDRTKMERRNPKRFQRPQMIEKSCEERMKEKVSIPFTLTPTRLRSAVR